MSGSERGQQSFLEWLATLLCLRPARENNQAADPAPLPGPAVGRLFGAPIEKIYEDESLLQEGVPLPLYQCTEALQDVFDLEGLFRVSGIFSEMGQMKQTFEQGETPDFSNAQSKHSITGLLEMWFRELPEPITTHKLYTDFLACVSDGDVAEDEVVERLSNCVEQMPEQNRVVLAFFLRLLNQIAAEEEENKMGAKNLGVVFGSVLLGAEVFCFSLEMKKQMEDQNTVIFYLIKEVDTFFPLDTFPYPFPVSSE